MRLALKNFRLRVPFRLDLTVGKFGPRLLNRTMELGDWEQELALFSVRKECGQDQDAMSIIMVRYGTPPIGGWELGVGGRSD